MTLQDTIIETNWKNTIKTTWNRLHFNADDQLNDNETEDIYNLILLRLNNLLPLNICYNDIETADIAWNRYLTNYTIALVKEFKSLSKSFQHELGKGHRQHAFTPIDNNNLEDTPIEIDESTFTWYDNLKANAEYFYKNSKVLNELYKTFRLDCQFLMGI